MTRDEAVKAAAEIADADALGHQSRPDWLAAFHRALRERGYVVVPVEPSAEIILAGLTAAGVGSSWYDSIQSAYGAALVAECESLNKWADGFDAAARKERLAAEQIIKELRQKLSTARAEAARKMRERCKAAIAEGGYFVDIDDLGHGPFTIQDKVTAAVVEQALAKLDTLPLEDEA